jgi:crotonobetainyl-CoA:carnitine CoA-transferase CaiB-like acyl-CoA transferase
VERAHAEDAAEVWLERLAALGIPSGKVRTLDEVYTWDQTLSQGLLIDVEHPTVGPIQLPGPPLRFDGLPHAGARAAHLPPPRLGEHDESVRAWLDSLEP